MEFEAQAGDHRVNPPTNASTIIPKPSWTKQDEQSDCGRTKRSKLNRINISLPPPQCNAQMYGYHISEKWLYEKARFFLAKL
ncbi:hypothetical protein DFJ58DRAFT_722470 [Suillus subalutaceus]|uniref:uncharacterized protein n=1 Tax=Suillus subalutaceus TaxID=48586 RepID=UPI001B87C132|nr:uncharacterized protein DFJ58DRAFT_722470 [Suillus subalutaceus]KAG1871737.1 hypothetical protein DFJ58DRAFT_722470 [Suillus subalutaceus]